MQANNPHTALNSHMYFSFLQTRTFSTFLQVDDAFNILSQVDVPTPVTT